MFVLLCSFAASAKRARLRVVMALDGWKLDGSWMEAAAAYVQNTGILSESHSCEICSFLHFHFLHFVIFFQAGDKVQLVIRELNRVAQKMSYNSVVCT
jgi:hypothetical protein